MMRSEETVPKKEQDAERAWVLACEEAFAERLTEVTEEILAAAHTPLIRLCGPTCSGKTTASHLLADRFAARGRILQPISIDDFYYDKSVLHALSERDGGAEIDYDSVKTIDLAALRRFLTELRREGESRCPIFDFKAGKRVGYRPVSGGRQAVFLFEGIQALYPEVVALFEEEGQTSVGLYIAPSRAIRAGGAVFEPNELRLMRRLVRDERFRGTGADLTLSLWEGVRRNEETHIFPYVSTCTHFADSAMAYEPGMLRPHLCKILERVPPESPNRPRAEELLQKLSGVVPLSDRLLPPKALYREFL